MSIKLALEELHLNELAVENDIPLSKHSSFRIGGNCALGIFPQSADELKRAVLILRKHQIKYNVVGRASNILFSDDGYDGALVFTEKMNSVMLQGHKTIYAEAGATLKTIANFALANSLSGLEFAHGIPGSLGGGVFMNAGAYGGEIADSIKYTDCYDIAENRFLRLNKEEQRFSYRHSVFANNKNLVVLGACFELNPLDQELIKATMNENMQKRKEKQPLEYPNAGSTFKRPLNGYAAQMIDECGLKGKTVGGAQVSTKHAGFVVNIGNATASDVISLMEIIKKEVYERFGVELEAEIQYIE